VNLLLVLMVVGIWFLMNPASSYSRHETGTNTCRDRSTGGNRAGKR